MQCVAKGGEKKWRGEVGSCGGNVYLYPPNLKDMKRVAIYGLDNMSDAKAWGVSWMVGKLAEMGVEVLCYEPFREALRGCGGWTGDGRLAGCFTTKGELEGVDMLFSVGGDGTFLDAVSFLGRSDVPLLGVNTGRLGFLTGESDAGMLRALDFLREGRYEVEERSVLEVEVDDRWNEELRYALNEAGVRRTDTSSLLTIRVWVDEEELATYWADGLLVATPSGSTAYSMSCGGPIVWPTCDVLLLTPVCPHNLSMRPLVLPGDAAVRLEVESRTGEFVVSADSRAVRLETGHTLCVLAAPFKVKVVRLPWRHFGRVLREKLMWGEDARNKGGEYGKM